MKILIKETMKINHLKIRDVNDIELSSSMVNKETKQYEMDQNEYEWLKEYINNNAETGVALASRGSYKTCKNFINHRSLTHDVITIRKRVVGMSVKK
ncbi:MULTISPECIES: hypothetical protein [Clostridium]|uniref:Uncharacterized protein n=1 Tax=Clostridium frigoriphilum TaxID=443253 RepID=A0ABU7URM7_9CLOT|nr:hypothetical protein [Clostridium sp. DSM 17811]MBU3099310.1 hypothetical protein [Clostridium sp. DSM 17811]